MNTLASTEVLNFIVTGQLRSGANVVSTSINAHPQAVCHGDLLHSSEDVRRDVHETYFGTRQSEVPDWFDSRYMSPEQYLTTRVFDHPLREEKVVGTKLLYPHLQANMLWDHLRERCLQGDFVVIHVKRNPLACYISMKQAAKGPSYVTKVTAGLEFEVPPTVSIDPKEFTEFCRWHAAHEARVAQLYDDRLEIDYRELCINYREVMKEVFDFLELPPCADVRPGMERLKNRNIRERVYNFTYSRDQMPHDVRAFFDDKNLF